MIQTSLWFPSKSKTFYAVVLPATHIFSVETFMLAV